MYRNDISGYRALPSGSLGQTKVAAPFSRPALGSWSSPAVFDAACTHC